MARVLLRLLAAVVAAAVLAAGLGLVAVAATPSRVHACTLELAPPGAALIADQVARAELIVVGRVITEERAHESAASAPTYRAAVLVRATLAGELEQPLLVIEPLGWLGSACDGGHRLLEGEAVLLFLRSAPGESGRTPAVTFSDWQGIVGAAKYFFEDEQAFLERDYDPTIAREPAAAGDTQSLITRIARAAGSSDSQRDDAIDFLLDQGGRDLLLPGLAAAGGATALVLIVLAVGFWRARGRAPLSGP